MLEEQVLGIPTSIFADCGYFEGFVPFSDKMLPVFDSSNQEFRPRVEAEKDPSFKQLIPYIVLMRGNLILNYFRGRGQGEKRLRGRRSLGIGGHINPCDLTDAVLGRLADRPDFLDDRYVNGMLRELIEEIKFKSIPEEWDAPIVGLINDDSNDVGKVHLGVVHVLRLERGMKLHAREKDILDLSWHLPPVLMQARFHDQFEPWSQIVLPHWKSWQPPKRKKKLVRKGGR